MLLSARVAYILLLNQILHTRQGEYKLLRKTKQKTETTHTEKPNLNIDLN